MGKWCLSQFASSNHFKHGDSILYLPNNIYRGGDQTVIFPESPFKRFILTRTQYSSTQVLRLPINGRAHFF
jgi:hypothetical protein